jgi:hypothetical protein
MINPTDQKSLLQKAGQIAADIIVSDEELEASVSETTIEMGFPFFRIKKSIKKTKK